MIVTPDDLIKWLGVVGVVITTVGGLYRLLIYPFSTALKLQKELTDSLRKELTDTRTELEELRKTLSETQIRLDDAGAKRLVMLDDITAARKQYTDLKVRYNNLSAQLTDLRASTQAQVAQVQTESAALRNMYTKTQEELNRLQAENLNLLKKLENSRKIFLSQGLTETQIEGLLDGIFPWESVFKVTVSSDERKEE